MFMDIDSDKLYTRRIDDVKKKLCSNCYLSECLELGCIKETSEGRCECQCDHTEKTKP